MKPRVLIAEGDESLGSLFPLCLARNGFQPDWASNGLDCLQRLRECRYDALVLSLELPWGGGDGVLATLREDSDRSDLPVILTSTLATREELSRLGQLPVVATLRKPFSLMLLVDCLRDATRELRSYIDTAGARGRTTVRMLGAG